MKKTTVLKAALLLCFFTAGHAQIPPTSFYGINHWMPKKYLNFPNNPNGRIETPAIQQLVKNAGAVFYRIGGNGYDENGTAIGLDSSSNDYIRAIQIVLAQNSNAKFLIQVPFEASGFTADSAAKLVNNVTALFSGVVYYSIGNEWDAYRHPNTKRFLTSDIASGIKTFAVKMKAANPNIKIVAPSLSFFSATDSIGDPIMSRLIGGADDITMIISGSGFTQLDGLKYYVDVINFHSYGGSNGNLSTATTATPFNTRRNGLINYAGVNGVGFSQDLDDLITLLNSANGSRSSSPLTFAITEMNVCFVNQPSPVSGDKYTNTTEGLSARSFFAGQHFADILSTTILKGTASGNAKVEFVMPWSIHEAGGSGGAGDLSMTKGAGTTSAPTPVSTYYHYQMMAQYMRGRFFPTTFNNEAPNVKAFVSVADSAGGYVMILNRDSVSYPCRIALKSNNPTNDRPLRLGFSIPTTALILDSVGTGGLLDTVPGNTTLLILYNCHGRKMWKKKYSLSDAINDGIPHFKQIGDRNVDPDIEFCETGMFEGDVSSDVTYSNTTVYITGDVNITGTTKLILDNVIAVVSPGVLISGDSNSSIEIINGTVMFGCDGPWEGIKLDGNYTTTQKLKVENSYIYNALYPVRTKKVADISVKGNVIANGITAISLDSSRAFTIEGNIVGCFTVGIETSNTMPSYSSKIKLNEIIDTETSITFTVDGHTNLDLSCNILNFTEFGLSSRTTTLQDIGTPLSSAGNLFQKTSATTPADFIDHTGSATTYYYGPIEAALYSGYTVMNLTQVAAIVDDYCAVSVLAIHNCKSLIVGVQGEKKSELNEFLIYPNPSNGEFTLELKDVQDNFTMNIYDVMGRIIESRKVDFTSERSETFDIKTRGLYIVTLTNEHTRLTKKVIVD